MMPPPPTVTVYGVGAAKLTAGPFGAYGFPGALVTKPPAPPPPPSVAPYPLASPPAPPPPTTTYVAEGIADDVWNVPGAKNV